MRIADDPPGRVPRLPRPTTTIFMRDADGSQLLWNLVS
jgi:hypothetical protein